MDEPLTPAEHGVWVPDWLGPSDHVWIEALLDEARRGAGQPRRELDRRLRSPLRVPAPPARWRAARAWLASQLSPAPVASDPTPRQLRAALFAKAHEARREGAFARDRIVARAAADLALEPGDVDARLFGDLAPERAVVVPPLPGAQEVALLVNLAIAQRLLRKAAQIDLHVVGDARSVLRHIRLRRLLCLACPAEGGARIQISGPVSLFRQTTRYGRALATVVASLRGADRFTLLAHHANRHVRIASGDPVFPAGAPTPRFDSALEERFHRDFLATAPDWDLVREPEPVAVGGSFVFPDFAIVHRRDVSRRWLLEIVGFWTPEYLDAKLDRLTRAGRRDLIVCVDERGDCGARDWGPTGVVVRFNRRLDPQGVLAIIERAVPVAPPTPAPRRERTTTAHLFVDWAGRIDPGDAVHRRLGALRVGDSVRFAARGDWMFVVDAEGRALATLSAAGKLRWEPRLGSIVSITVAQKLWRVADQSHEPWRSRLKCTAWWIATFDVALASQ